MQDLIVKQKNQLFDLNQKSEYQF